jgi:hypothetical protein
MQITAYFEAGKTITANGVAGVEGEDAGVYTFTLPDATSDVLFYEGSDLIGAITITPTATIPASGNVATVNAYLYTLDPSGNPEAGKVLYYRLLGVPTGTGRAWDDNEHTATSNDAGLVQVEMAKGATYLVWFDNSQPVAVAVAADAGDPYALPQMVG